MPKYLSGRVKRTPQGALTTDRYQYLGLDQAEPNLGDPPELDAIPSGTKYQIVSLIDRPGERFWQEIGGGLIPGTITVRDEGLVIPRTDANPNLGINSITDINFVGAAVTVIGFIKPDGDAGTAVTVTISAPGDNHGIIFNNDGEFDTSPFLTFDNSVGIGSVGIGTTSPTQNLHVVGNFRLEGTFFDEENGSGSTGDLLIRTVNGGLKYASGNSIQAGAGGTITQVQFHDSTGLVGGADNFVFDFTNNRIGIGSTQPDRLLDVLGNSRFTGITTFVGITTFTDDVTFLTSNSKNIFFDKSSDSLTFGDDVEARFGSGNNGDGLIYHDGSDFYINSKVGDLNLKVNLDTAIKAKQNSGVELYFDNIKRLETTASGIDVSGTLNVTGISTLIGQVGFGTHATFPDDAIIKLGDAEELKISHQTDGETIIRENGLGNLNILGSDIIFKNSSLGLSKKYAEFKNGGEIKLYHNNLEKFQTTGLGVSVTGLTSTTDLGVTGVVTSNLMPGVNEFFDIGSDPNSGGKRWNKIYANEFIGQIQVTQQNFIVNNLLVNGISTFIGIATFGRGIVVESGVSTFRDPVGILTDLIVTGISTFSGLTTVTSTDHALHTKKLSVSGVSTFFNTVNVKTAGGSVIQDASGTLDVRANIISLENNAGNATFAKFSNGGSAELYFNNTKTFETVSFGATVPGTFFTNQLDVVGFSTFRDTILVKDLTRLRFGDSNKRIFSESVDLNINVNATGDLNLKACANGASTGKINIVNVGSGITVNPDSSVDVYHESSKKLETTVHGIDVTGHIETDTLNVTGLSTFGPGVTTQKSTLFANQLSVSGLSTFFNTVNVKTAGGSVIQDASGTLDICANTLNLKDQTNTSVHLTALANDKVELYYANAAKLATNQSGISVTGSLITSVGVSTIGGHVYPSVTNTHNLGKDDTLRWNKVYAAEYYGVFKGSIGPNIPVDRADTVKITDDTTVTGVHYIHFGDDATTDNYDAVEVDSTGLVYKDRKFGIGTNDPAGMLEVQKNGVPAIISNYNNSKHIQMDAGGSGAGFQLTTGHHFAINHQPYADRGTNNNLTERFRITPTGDVSLPDDAKIKFGDSGDLEIYHGNSPYNPSSPDQHSYIRDNGTGDLVLLSNQVAIRNAAETEDMARFYENGSVELRYDNVKRLATSGIGVTITGELHVNHVRASGIVTATDFDSLSDRTLKTNIQVIDNPIDKIMKIDGVSFNWKDTNKPSLGVIADNVEEILPDLVSNDNPKTVNYNGLVGLLIEVVKNQQNQIDELRGFLDK